MTLSIIGKRIGNYDIQAKIGEGGMGMVYLGLHPQIGKRVAIKVLHEELSSKADVVSRFFTEARSVNDISHPNIVDIVDFGDITLDGTLLKYIIMEFLDGESLSSRIRREGVTIRETLHIIAQCASALAASHGKGVVHRDLKPENIYLCGRGADRNYVKLLDFGIAKLTGEGGAAMSSRTRTGMVIGTPAYMSPEQCEGRGNIDHRSDIYALGVVMYELLTGRVPFPGDGFGEVLVAHLTREPDAPTQLNQNIPPEIEAIVLHCLRKDRTQRIQSMNEMLAAIADPAAHYQTWMHSAHMPSGVASSNAMMSTVMATGQSALWTSGAMPVAPNAGAVNPMMMSGAMQLGSSGAQPAYGGGTLALMPDQPVISGQPPRPPTGVMRPVGTGTQGQVVHPTTLSGASGEAASGGRRPMPVLLGFVAALIIGVAGSAAIKTMGKPRPDVVDNTPPVTPERPVRPVVQPKTPVKPPAPELVTIQVRATPPEAEVLRAAQPGGPLEKVSGSFQVKKGSGPIELKVQLAGYGAETRSVATDANQTVEVALAKVEPEQPPPEGTERRRHHRDRTKNPSGRGRGKKDPKNDGNELLKPIF